MTLELAHVTGLARVYDHPGSFSDSARSPSLLPASGRAFHWPLASSSTLKATVVLCLSVERQTTAPWTTQGRHGLDGRILTLTFTLFFALLGLSEREGARALTRSIAHEPWEKRLHDDTTTSPKLYLAQAGEEYSLCRVLPRFPPMRPSGPHAGAPSWSVINRHNTYTTSTPVAKSVNGDADVSADGRRLHHPACKIRMAVWQPEHPRRRPLFRGRGPCDVNGPSQPEGAQAVVTQRQVGRDSRLQSCAHGCGLALTFDEQHSTSKDTAT